MAIMDPATARPSIEEIFRDIEDHSVLQVWGCEHPARACDGGSCKPKDSRSSAFIPEGNGQTGGANSGRTIQSELRLARLGCQLLTQSVSSRLPFAVPMDAEHAKVKRS